MASFTYRHDQVILGPFLLRATGRGWPRARSRGRSSCRRRRHDKGAYDGVREKVCLPVSGWIEGGCSRFGWSKSCPSSYLQGTGVLCFGYLPFLLSLLHYYGAPDTGTNGKEVGYLPR